MTPRKLQEMLTTFSDSEKRMVLSAYEAAEEALQGKMRSNNHPFIEHPLAIAHIVCQNEDDIRSFGCRLLFILIGSCGLLGDHRTNRQQYLFRFFAHVLLS